MAPRKNQADSAEGAGEGGLLVRRLLRHKALRVQHEPGPEAFGGGESGLGDGGVRSALGGETAGDLGGEGVGRAGLGRRDGEGGQGRSEKEGAHQRGSRRETKTTPSRSTKARL